MAQQRPMSTPIFDELLREFSIRIEEQRRVPLEQPEPAAAQVSAQAGQANQVAHLHRAE